ncbi:response regulator transcription factor [Streptomyces sp. NPDC049910]|uniref:LytR/AlgR family response regulator transcription factor n=1 Tax=Streptomyces sp. NPDC049910 TaxID=3155278 RepID=UPI00341F2D5C
MLRVLAVDDEKPALGELLYLLRSDPRVRSADGATDATEALRRISRALDAGPGGESGIDVVFLDIHMAGLTGLDMARLLSEFTRPPLIVFVTAHEGFAVQAFDLKAVDYVLKPVRRERLAEAVRRVCDLATAARTARPPAAAGSGPAGGAGRRGGAGGAGGAGASGAMAAHRPGPAAGPLVTGSTAPGTAPEQIPVELGGVTRLIPIDEITYVEAHGDYARLHTRGGSHLVRIPLSTLEDRWASRGFVRIHRSHLVALGCIDELRLDGGSTTVRVGTAELAVSRRHARQLRDLLMRHAQR